MSSRSKDLPDGPSDDDDADDDDAPWEPEPIELPIDGCLDLHTFSPRDLRTLVPDYIDACASLGLTEVRIIHGKGRGELRRSVHALLGRHPRVASFRLAQGDRGGWGATVATLKPGSTDTDGRSQ